jgi:DNA-binding SARP family transcriptional activator
VTDGLRFHLLGTLRVTRNGIDIAVGHRLQQAVLALLAIHHGRVVERDSIIDELWAEQVPSTAVNIVQTYVARLRKALEPRRGPYAPASVLTTDGRGYVLAVDPSRIDTFVFERDLQRADSLRRNGDLPGSVSVLRMALGSWHGGALRGLPGGEIAAERERLHELRWGAFERLASGELLTGRAQDLVGELKAAVSQQPLRERLWEYLMLALEQSGRSAEALAAYRQSRALLLTELGVEPGRELRDIHQRILATR